MLARCVAIALLVCGSTLASAQKCPLPGPAAAAPAWVSGSGSQSDDALYAAGVAESKRNTPLNQMRDEARTSALAALAQQVQVEIRSVISNSIQKVTKGGKSQVNEDFNDLSTVQSQLVLRSTQVVEQWSDMAACRLWVRVRITRSEAELARRAAASDVALAGLRKRLEFAADNKQPVANRQAALAEAQELASLVDPALSSGFSRDGFELQRVELAATLAAQRQREDGYRNDMTQHVQAMALAGGTTDANAKRQAQRLALGTLERALAAAPDGVVGFTLPFVPTERLATLYAELGMVCSGRQWFERRNLAAPAQLAATRCDATVLAREQRVQYLSGKTVQVSCSLRVGGGTPSDWPKACGALQAKLASEGAVPLARGATAQLQIELRGEGEVLERKDAESGHVSWRFRGKLISLLHGPEALEINDNFDTQTGWDPSPVNFATDVVALLAVEHLDTALSAYLGK